MSTTPPFSGRTTDNGYCGLCMMGAGGKSITSDDLPGNESDDAAPLNISADVFRSIIRQELKLIKDSLAYEIQASKEECLEIFEDLRLITQKARAGLQGREIRQGRAEAQPANSAGLHQNHQEQKPDKLEEVLVRDSKKDSLESGTVPTPYELGGDHAELWEMAEFEKNETSHSWFSLAFERILRPEKQLSQRHLSGGCHNILPSHAPKNSLVTICDSTIFQSVQVIAVLLNTAFSAFMADQSVRRLLKDPPETPLSWWEATDTVFTIYFCAELVFRLLAFRLFFFISPTSWVWNVFDLILCTISVAASGLNLNVLRSLRVFRVVRMVRVISESSYLPELRTLLSSVMDCMIPLFWAVLFLAMTFLIFSMFIMQAVGTTVLDFQDNEELMSNLRAKYMGYERCFLTLLACILGEDWLAPHEMLADLGHLNVVLIPLFVIFVNIGVLNIVVGVFTNAQTGNEDFHTIALKQMSEVEEFCRDMKNIFQGMDESETGKIQWSQFKEYFYREEIQAYLAYHGLDTSHVKLLFAMIDRDNSGSVNMRQMIIGMLRLKGHAKGLDTRVLLHGLKRTVKDIQSIQDDVAQIKQDLCIQQV